MDSDVLFLEEDCVLRQDALLMNHFLVETKAERHDVLFTSLAGDSHDLENTHLSENMHGNACGA